MNYPDNMMQYNNCPGSPFYEQTCENCGADWDVCDCDYDPDHQCSKDGHVWDSYYQCTKCNKWEDEIYGNNS